MPVFKTALLSYGMSGRVFHAPFIEQHPGFELAGCWERSARRINERYPTVTSHATLDDLLADSSLDLVVINTPTLTHHEYTKKVLESGKHAVVEKAFAGNAKEARELRDLARVRGLKLAVFQNRRWDSDFLSMRRVLQDGVLGDVVEANLAYQRFDANLSPKAHKEEPSSGSGIVKDLGPHVIDQALALFGMPRAVFADIAVTRPDSKVDDYFDILLLHDDKLKRRADVQERQLDEGMMPSDPGYGVEPAGSEGRLYTAAAEPVIMPAPPGNYMAFYDGMFRSIAENSKEPVTAEDGVNVMRVIDAAFQSQRERTVVTL
jgi:predicted dehydrogenase